MSDLRYLEGRKFCVVFVQVLDEGHARVQLQCLRGRASIERGHLHVVTASGAMFAVPGSALPNIEANDGTKILKDAEYYVLVKADPNLKLMRESEVESE